MNLLGIVGKLGLGCCVFLLLACQGEKPEVARSNEEVVISDSVWSGIGFGIPMSMELYGVTEAQYDHLSRYVENEVQILESVASLYSHTSELSRLNDQRELLGPSKEFLEVLMVARELEGRTQGYFQPAIHAAWVALEEGRPEADVKALLVGASMDALEVGEQRVSLKKHKTSLSFNAFIQGYLTDRVAQEARKQGVQSALLHLGETYALGKHPEGRAWTLAIMGTVMEGGETDLVGTVDIEDAGLAVSAHEASRKLLSPKEGVLQQDCVVAVVSREGAATADAFATAFAVAPEERWAALFESLVEEAGGQVVIWVENKEVFRASR
ncbi:FAD:protein FMN transferase [Rubritalea tangerina]|uniref:FAD:protein FMN transferase n=1 Tax=Rubritalea tangerina TaxID=430798 RepID=A0ABW4Z6R8_9BACT